MGGIIPPQDYWIKRMRRAERLLFLSILLSFILGGLAHVGYIAWRS